MGLEIVRLWVEGVKGRVLGPHTGSERLYRFSYLNPRDLNLLVSRWCAVFPELDLKWGVQK